MKRIQLEIKALSPLAIAKQKPGGSISEAVDYIPGTVIRGAVAAQILNQSGHQFSNLSENGGDFQTLFLGETSAIFQNAYPAVIRKSRIEIQSDIRVVPATALSSKNDSGFKTKKGANGVFDTLIDRFCADRYGYPYDPNCPKDWERVDAYTGFYSKLGKNYYTHSADKRLLTRVGINRRRATAEDEILYSIEVLNESQVQKKKPEIYSSAILVTDELADSLKEFIDSRSQNFRLGGSASRGLGRVEIKTKEPVDAKIDVSDRIAKFTDALRKRWEQWQIFGNPLAELPGDRTYFTLDLQSDAILTENWRRTTVISEAMLKQFAAVEDSSLKLEAAYSSYDYKSGWNSAWGLMKDVELITNKGGVYLFSTTQRDIWVEKLGELEVRGVGDRACEGFGQIQICNEFHLIFRENAV
ncbi:type III-D CRISPR-associated RAMP protein Csx10 [Microseira wollei]|uniref:Csx10 family CRISPR-associated RAMP protein n=1 Tax=Microseira wollei NIES-4236 TaxID=2530354 RepID=A0AAV3XP09_9CYAN|nr:CRISPR-associated RAMP protein Csx10 [Microseira wollei]GET41935.1 Csx10 family CRISPR-associated RAMP protein [Microseira wollei NIES-4236]